MYLGAGENRQGFLADKQKNQKDDGDGNEGGGINEFFDDGIENPPVADVSGFQRGDGPSEGAHWLLRGRNARLRATAGRAGNGMLISSFSSLGSRRLSPGHPQLGRRKPSGPCRSEGNNRPSPRFPGLPWRKPSQQVCGCLPAAGRQRTSRDIG